MVATKAESGEQRAKEKGVRNLLCKAPFGPFWQKAPGTFFLGGFLMIAAEIQPSEKLPPPTRAIILMALLGILLLGLFLVVFILLGGNWVRRLGKHRRGPSVPPDVAPLQSKSDRDFSPPAGKNRQSASPPMAITPSDSETQVTDETQDA